MKKIALLALLSIVALNAVPVLAQCPMCKTALNSNADGKNKRKVGNGINKGILFLLSAPYLLVGTAGFIWYKNSKKRKPNG
jgi:hypothetical protein